MKFQELLDFIEKVDSQLEKQYDGYPDKEKRILARTVKMTEEIGELCDAVLTHISMQRKQKLQAHKVDNLPEEIADALITVLLLAKLLGVNVEKALERKMQKVNKRLE